MYYECILNLFQAVNSGALKLDPSYNTKVWNEFMSDEKSR